MENMFEEKLIEREAPLKDGDIVKVIEEVGNRLVERLKCYRYWRGRVKIVLIFEPK